MLSSWFIKAPISLVALAAARTLLQGAARNLDQTKIQIAISALEELL